MEKVLDRLTQFRIFLVSLVAVLGAWAVVLLVGGNTVDVAVGLAGGAMFGTVLAMVLAWIIFIAKGPTRDELMARLRQGEQLLPAERLLLGFRVVQWMEIVSFTLLGFVVGSILFIANGIIVELVLGIKFARGESGLLHNEVVSNWMIYWFFAQTLGLILFKRCWKKFEWRFGENSMTKEDHVVGAAQSVENVKQKDADEKLISLRVFRVISPEGELKEMVVGPTVRGEKLAKRLASHLKLRIVRLSDDVYALEGANLGQDALLRRIKEIVPDKVVVIGAA